MGDRLAYAIGVDGSNPLTATMNELAATLLYPVFAQVALTFALLVWLVGARVGAAKSGAVKLKDIALDPNAWPPKVRQIGNSVQSQFELPVLFYVLVVLIFITWTVTPVQVGLAWLFVVLRYAHAAIHTGSNNVLSRFKVYAAGLAVLLVMWVLFIATIVLTGLAPPAPSIR
jgi:hypothetical protein